MRENKTALSYWFPRLTYAGLPVPKTWILHMPKEAQACVWAAFDGKDGAEGEQKTFREFVADLKSRIDEAGLPAFLRTDHTSGKHNWKRTCFVPSSDPKDIGSHIFAIAEFSEICDMIGLPWDTWVVREYLPIKPLGVCPGYEDMPLCREFRFFVNDGEVVCWHPYWPMDALEQGGADVSLYEKLTSAPEDYATLYKLAFRAARAIEGAWSVDILETERGWYITDMAEAHKSYHWSPCEFPNTVAPTHTK